MTNFLIQYFIKEPHATSHSHVRHQYGLLGGTIGIFCNAFLFITKLFIGMISNSMSIIADSVNNLSDAGSSVITLVGFKISSKPADKNHPFGHARVEYISGLFISIIIIFLGLQLVISSVNKILTPEALVIQPLTFIILIFSIFVKLWLYAFNRTLGEKIDSTTLMATAKDSLNDVITTSGILLSITISYFFSINLDGYIGIVVACFIIYSGIELIKDTISPLLGEAPSETLVTQIRETILSYPGVLGFHDLVVHSYGPNRCFSSVHVEVDASEDILVSHDLIDKIEREFMFNLGIHMVIHLDPVTADDAYTTELKLFIINILEEIDAHLSIHDFRIVQGASHTNLLYDVTVPPHFSLSHQELLHQIDQRVQIHYPHFHNVITVDTNYIATPVNQIK